MLLLVLNHAGDMLCGNMVMKMAAKAGMNVRKVVTQEDISNAPRSNADDRRGLAGAIPLYHIAAAAAREGKSLDEVADLAQRYADSMATIAVAARCATHPRHRRRVRRPGRRGHGDRHGPARRGRAAAASP